MLTLDWKHFNSLILSRGKALKLGLMNYSPLLMELCKLTENNYEDSQVCQFTIKRDRKKEAHWFIE